MAAGETDRLPLAGSPLPTLLLMLMPVAPLTLHVRVLDSPGAIVCGLAVNEAMTGAEMETVAVALTVPDPLLAVSV